MGNKEKLVFDKISDKEFEEIISEKEKIAYLDLTKDLNNRDVEVLTPKELKEKIK